MSNNFLEAIGFFVVAVFYVLFCLPGLPLSLPLLIAFAVSTRNQYLGSGAIGVVFLITFTPALLAWCLISVFYLGGLLM